MQFFISHSTNCTLKEEFKVKEQGIDKSQFAKDIYWGKKYLSDLYTANITKMKIAKSKKKLMKMLGIKKL